VRNPQSWIQAGGGTLRHVKRFLRPRYARITFSGTAARSCPSKTTFPRTSPPRKLSSRNSASARVLLPEPLCSHEAHHFAFGHIEGQIVKYVFPARIVS